jgi:predicted transcriptional regulator
VGKSLLQKVLRKFAFCDISPLYRAPFDFVMNVPNGKCVIVGGVALHDERNLDNRLEEIRSICHVIRARPVLITEKSRVFSDDVSCFCMEELSGMRALEDLIAAV